MNMDLTARQICSLGEQGCTVEQISKELDVESALVKLILSRNNVSGASDRDITDEDLKLLRRKAVDLALGAEDESVQARMTMFLIERDRPAVRAPTSPLVAINQAIISANENFSRLLKEYETPPQEKLVDETSRGSAGETHYSTNTP